MTKTKIIIAGIGGVGGYFGGLMAHHFEHQPAVEIYFLARGAHLTQIQANGLRLKRGNKEWTARPHLATDRASDIGIADYVILCTKSYDLEAAVEQLQACINEKTIILPLLNGLNNQAIIQRLLPQNIVLEGCVYIISRLKEPGFVENSGNIQKLYFGLEGRFAERLSLLEKLFLAAGLEASYSAEIKTVIWEKFIFLSPIATATSYFDQHIGSILANPDSLAFLMALVKEAILLAQAKEIKLVNDIQAKTLAKYHSLPFETTSSMHSDFIAQKSKHELEALTGFVVKESLQHNTLNSNYQIAYAKLKP